LLQELTVRDVGIIDEISWRLGAGLNVITGETGAGKSLVIDAVEALLGSRPDQETVRYGADAARIEGVFDLSNIADAARLRETLAERGIPSHEEVLVVHCELRRQGRTVIRVNGQAVPRGVLVQIGQMLVDVHGQSDHLSLLDRKRHLDFLDAYAGTTEQRASFAAEVTKLDRMEQELKTLSENERETARQEEFLRFQIDEISRAELHEGEDEELERERTMLASAETLKALSYEAYRNLRDDDAGTVTVADGLGEAVSAMRKLAELDPGMKDQLDSLEETLYSIEDAAREIRTYSDRLEDDPRRLEEVESRLDLIKELKRKYGQSIAEVLAYQEKGTVDLEGLTHSTERRAELEEASSLLKQDMGHIAADLSRKRVEAAERLKTGVKNELGELDMALVEFDVAISQEPSEDGIPFPDGVTRAFDSTGADDVEFFASTNPGEPLKPLARIASTGEMSRFMLALKGVLAETDNTPVLVFDEIDIGVGGRSGEVVGRKLSTLSRNHQIICVTHLPQIAAFADSHHRVHKEVSDDRTLSRLQTLEGEARIQELAAMFAGPDYTRASLDSARELVAKAERWKRET